MLVGGIFDGDVELVVAGRVRVGFVFLVLGDVHAAPAGVKAFCRGGPIRVCWILTGAVPVEALVDGAGGQGVGFSGEVPGFEDAIGGPDDFLVPEVGVVDEDDGGDVGVGSQGGVLDSVPDPAIVDGGAGPDGDKVDVAG